MSTYYNLTKKQSPKTDEDKEFMAKVSDVFAIGSLMYVVVCTRADVTHIVGVVKMFMSNPWREY